MLTDSKKIQIIEAVLKTDDEETLTQINNMVNKTGRVKKEFSAHDFAGTLSKEDAALMAQAITDGCEQINPDDWK